MCSAIEISRLMCGNYTLECHTMQEGDVISNAETIELAALKILMDLQ
jgi:hypothetical protein